MPHAAPKHTPRLAEGASKHVVPVVENWGQGRGGRPWRRTRARILHRDEGLCQPCKRAGRLRVAHEVDHIVPLTAGGTGEDVNLESICIGCHKAKTQREQAAGRNVKHRGRVG